MIRRSVWLRRKKRFNAESTEKEHLSATLRAGRGHRENAHPTILMNRHVDPMSKNVQALVFLRICVGILFLIFGQYKVFGTQFTLHGGFEFWINKFLQDGAYPFMAPVLRGFVLPHARPIAFLVAYGELAIGIALTLGVWVRRASAFGLLYMVTLLFSSNYPGAGAPMWQYFGASLEHSVLGICFIAFLIGKSDAIWAVGGREE
jgi:uncharacterized membrane protein YphA (DoxX/SURF4 family)